MKMTGSSFFLALEVVEQSFLSYCLFLFLLIIVLQVQITNYIALYTVATGHNDDLPIDN